MDIPKTIKARVELVQKIINETTCTEDVAEEANKFLKYLFVHFYTPSYGINKVKEENIIKFSVDLKCVFYYRLDWKKSLVLHYLTESGEEKTQFIGVRFLCGSKRTISTDLNRALRLLIREQTGDFFEENKGIAKVHEVDHIVPFKKLKDDFLSKIDKNEIENLIIKDSKIINNPQLCEKWIKYHKQHAKLQLLLKKEHKAKTTIECKTRKNKKNDAENNTNNTSKLHNTHNNIN